MLADHPIHPTLPASDLDRARAFYTEKLGFPPPQDSPGGLIFRSGDLMFLVFPSGGEASGSHTQMGWRVPDVEAEVAALQDRGVVFEEYDIPTLKTVNGVADVGNGKAAWFKDSEGNMLGVIQMDPSLG